MKLPKLPKLPKSKNKLEFIILLSIPILIVISTIVIVVSMLYLFNQSRKIGAASVTDSFDDTSLIDTENSSGYAVSGGSLKTEGVSYSFGDGADGSIVVSSNTNINTDHLISSKNAICPDAPNYSVTALTSNTATVTPEPNAFGCLSAGDEVIIINLAGTSNSVDNLGKFEILEVQEISGSIITFTSNKTNYYGENFNDDTNLGTTTSNQRVMLQRVPNYTDVTVNAGVTFSPSSWDGAKGGVIFFKASGDVIVNGTISANFAGYTGAPNSGGYTSEAKAGNGAFYTNAEDGEGGSADDLHGNTGKYSGGGGGSKAVGSSGSEGTGGAGSTIPGASGGGGGGSLYRTSSGTSSYGGAGGGGGHATGGGGGQGCAYAGDGSALSSGAGSRGDYCTTNKGGGGGGGSTYGIADLTKLTIGGGGGAGGFGMHYNGEPNNCSGGGGGDGAGIVYIEANSLVVSGAITAKGEGGNAPECGYGGSGGGGAGGSIKIIGDSLTLGSDLIDANGGAGHTTGMNGGNGGDGRVRIEYATSSSGSTTPNASSQKLAGYSNSAVIQSVDLISGDSAGSIQSLQYNLSDLPENTSATLELSVDGINWENAPPGVEGNPTEDYSFGTGADGSIVVNVNSNINTDCLIGTRSAVCPDAPNYSVTALTTNTATVTPDPDVGNGCLSVGDEVFLLNQAGTSTSAINLGNFETLVVDDITGSTITFTTNKTKYYGDGVDNDDNIGTASTNQRVLLQRIPQYENVTVNEGISFSPSIWNGTKGGILVFRATGSVIVNGSISANQLGYQGAPNSGGYTNEAKAGNGAFYTNAEDGEGGSADDLNANAGTYSGGGGGGKEVNTGGTNGSGGAGSALIGSSGGGGGGSLYRTNSGTSSYGGGGGGGGHFTGGTGGQGCQYGGTGNDTTSGAGSDGKNCTYNTGGGGGGGSSTYGDSNLEKFTMGGGGGAGGFGMHYNGEPDNCSGGGGGDGGGIIFISGNTVDVNGSVSSDGTGGVAPECGYGGSGGGGAGGSVKVVGGTVEYEADSIHADGKEGHTTGKDGGDGGDGIVNIQYVSSSEVENPFVLSTGVNNTIDLTGFNWENSEFYYRVTYDTNSGAGTPVLDDITLNYQSAPSSPTIGDPEALSPTSIRWNFTDNATNEAGFKLLTDVNGVVETVELEDLGYIDETSLSPNTQYTRKVLAYNALGNSSHSETRSIYTLANIPTLSFGDITGSTIVLNAGNTNNLATESSGVYFDCEGVDCDSGINEWLQTTTDTVTGLSANTQYSFVAKARNGDGVETGNSGSVTSYTLAEQPSISIDDVTTSTIQLSASGTSNIGSGLSGYYFDCVGSGCDTGLNDWIQTTQDTVTGLLPNTEYGFQVKAKNGDEVQTSYSDSQLIYTLANTPGVPSKADSSPSSIDVTLDVNSNPESTQFVIQETSSGKYVNKDTGLLQVAPDWGTYSEFVSGGVARVTGLSAGTLYQFKVKARNGNDVETEFSTSTSAKTKVVVTNIPVDLTVELVSDNTTDLTTDGVDADSYEIRFKEGNIWIAEVPVDLNENRDYSTVVAEVESENSKAVVKLTGDHGFVDGTFDMYIPKNDTDYVRVCPNADNLNLVTESCVNGVDFEGPFPQTLAVGAGSVRIVSGSVGEVAYWKIEGLTGTGVLGLETPICGDGILGNTEGEECELDNPDEVSCSWAECNQDSCTCPEVTECGDGEFNVSGEECEDGNPSGYECSWSQCNKTTCKCPSTEETEDSQPVSTTSSGDEFVSDDGEVEESEEDDKDDEDLVLDPGDTEDETESKPTIPVEEKKEYEGVVRKAIKSVTSAVAAASERVTEFAEDNREIAGAIASTPVVTSATAVVISSGATLWDLPYRFVQFFLGVLQSLGIIRKKKEEKSWGVVYNSVTKEPVQNAVVRLFSEGLLIETEVTDSTGTFSFAPKSGVYEIEVSRSKFEFPSNLVSGRTDLLRDDVYRGGKYRVSSSGQEINISIPIDPIGQSPSVSYLRLLIMHISSILIALNPMFLVVGILLSLVLYQITGNILNLVIIGCYLAILAAQLISSFRQKTTWGVVRDENGKGVSGLKVGVYDKKYNKLIDVRVTDQKGRFRFLLPKDEYVLRPYKSDYSLVDKQRGGVEVKRKGDGVFYVSAMMRVKE